MGAPTPPVGWEIEAAPAAPKGWEIERPADEVRTVETPTGPIRVDREGRHVLTPEESQAHFDAAAARMKEGALGFTLATLSSGAQGSIPFFAGVESAKRHLLTPDAQLPEEERLRSIMDAYRHGRDEAAKTTGAAEKEAGLPAAILGQVPGMLAGAPTIAGRMLVNTGLGVVNGGLRSEADVTRGGAPRAMKDAAASGLVSVGLSGAGEALGAAAGGIGRTLGKQAELAEQATVDAERATLEKAMASARGRLGGETSAGSRTLEQAREALLNPNISPENKALAQALLNSDEGVKLANQVTANTVERGADQVGRIDAAKTDFIASATDIPGRAASSAAAKLEPGAVVTNLAGRAWRSAGQRALLGAIGYGAGSAVDSVMGNEGHQGGIVGALASGIAPGALQAVRNSANYAPAQALAARGVQKFAGAVGSFARAGDTMSARIAEERAALSKPKEQADLDAINAFSHQ